MFKKTFSTFAGYSGLNTLASLKLRDRVFILGYHSVTDKRAPRKGQQYYHDLSIDVTEFEAELLFLKKKGHTFIRFADLSHLKPTVKKPTIIYFDDGFKDNLEVALLILEKHGVPATVFVTTGFMDGTHIPLTAYFRFLLDQKGTDFQTIEQAIIKFKTLSYADRTREIESRDTFGARNLWNSFSTYLTWNNVIELSERGMEIGSHTVSHAKLTESDDASLISELQESKKSIEKKTNIPVVAFSYPHGRSDARVEQALFNAKYLFGVTTEEGLNTLESVNKDPYALKKIAPRIYESLKDFKARMYGRQLIRKYIRR